MRIKPRQLTIMAFKDHVEVTIPTRDGKGEEVFLTACSIREAVTELYHLVGPDDTVDVMEYEEDDK